MHINCKLNSHQSNYDSHLGLHVSVLPLSEFSDRIMVQSPFPLPSVSALTLRIHIRLGYSLVNTEGENGQVPQYYISFEQSPGRGVWRNCQEC